MTKCKRKLLPAEPYEIDALESWFSDLSAEGLHVQKANALYATFTEGEKKRLLFRMEPKQDGIFPALDESKAEERNAQHREKGWSFVCGLNRFYVYAAEEGTADYFATPQEEGAYYPDNLKGNKALNNRYTELLLTLLMIAGFIYITLRLTTYEWVTGSTSPVCNPAFLLLVIFSGQRIRGAIRLQNSLAAGEPHHRLAGTPPAAEALAVSGLDARDNCIHLPAVSAQCILFFRPTDCRGKAAPADDFSGGAGK